MKLLVLLFARRIAFEDESVRYTLSRGITLSIWQWNRQTKGRFLPSNTLFTLLNFCIRYTLNTFSCWKFFWISVTFELMILLMYANLYWFPASYCSQPSFIVWQSWPVVVAPRWNNIDNVDDDGALRGGQLMSRLASERVQADQNKSICIDFFYQCLTYRIVITTRERARASNFLIIVDRSVCLIAINDVHTHTCMWGHMRIGCWQLHSEHSLTTKASGLRPSIERTTNASCVRVFTTLAHRMNNEFCMPTARLHY